MPFNDETAPVITSAPRATDITDTSAAIQWQTDEAASSMVTVNGVTYTVPGYRTLHSVAVFTLTASQSYLATVSSTDEDGNGPVSSSASFDTLASPDSNAPVILEGPVITSVSNDRATVEWRTNEPATTQLNYGIGGLLDQSEIITGLRSIHSVTITGLGANSTYTIQVSGTDAAGNGPVESPEKTFQTLPQPDTEAPVFVSAPVITDLSSDSVTVQWETDEPAVSAISLNDGTAYKVVRDENLKTSHSVTVTGLTSSTDYTYTVSATDALGNGPELSAPDAFRTLALEDTLAPVITGSLKIVGITHQSAVVHWRTDELSDSTIEFGTVSGELVESLSSAKRSRKHVLQLTNLEKDTAYYLRALSKDRNGNAVVTEEDSFRTRSLPDTAKPHFKQPPTVIGSSDDTVTLAWETDEPSDSVVEYDSSTGEKRSKGKGEKTNKHTVTLTGLKAGGKYSYTIDARDSSGNKAQVQSLNTEIVGTSWLKRTKTLATSVLGIGSAHAVGKTDGFNTNAEPDTTAPLFSLEPETVWSGSNRIIMEWVNNEPATAELRYGQSGAYSHVASNADSTLDHQLVLTQLQPGISYDYKLTVTDIAGNKTVRQGTFSSAAANDTVAPSISSLSASVLGDTVVDFGLRTDEHASVGVRYGVSESELSSSAASIGIDRLHSLRLSGLAAGTTYHYQFQVQDPAGNSTLSPIQAVATSGTAVDSDGDGVPDSEDIFPQNSGEWLDTDGNGIGNNTDTDDDGDGVEDASDAFPLDAFESADLDSDGIGDNSDLDVDGDGTDNTLDVFPRNETESADTDLDGIGNNADTDDDEDGVDDGRDAFPLNSEESLDTDGDGIGNNTDTDDDGDGVDDVSDAFPLDAFESADLDSDGIGDNSDLDVDGDGTDNTIDAFPRDASESADTDLDGIGNNADTDDDGDGVEDGRDAFPLDSEESLDTDGDGIGNNTDTDDDGDGVEDASDAFPLDASESLDTDGNGIGNNADTDDDGDGLPDAFENENGFDSLDSSDASQDADNDGLSNLEEYEQGSDLFNPPADETAPVVIAPVDIRISASGDFTEVELGEASATDNVDGALAPLSDKSGPFEPGRHTITWSVSDAAGNTGTDAQIVDVLPIAGFEVDQFADEGSNVSVKVVLNGQPPEYPVTIPFELAGTADHGEDFTLSAQEISISEGREGSVVVDITSDDLEEMEEKIIIKMATPQNAVAGGKATHTIVITVSNQAPVASLNLFQNGIGASAATIDGGFVLVTSSIRDPNSNDTHTFDWNASDNAMVPSSSANPEEFRFDPAGLQQGVYIIRLTVTDNGTPPKSSSFEFPVTVISGAPLDPDENGNGLPDSLDINPDPSVMQATENGKLVTEAGLRLRIGSVASAGMNLSPMIDESLLAEHGSVTGGPGLNTEDSYTIIGGLFDFEIHDLRAAGQSVLLILPLSEAIPANGVYRKYVPDVGWQMFVEDVNNRLYSASSNGSECPAVGSNSYDAGIIEGNDCLQLRIQDGGPNDADAEKNGVIKDPSGVAVVSSSENPDGLDDVPDRDDKGDADGPESSSGGGGCTINKGAQPDPTLPLMVLISLIYLITKRRWSCKVR